MSTTTAATTAQADAFHGWFRPLRGRWRRVCTAPTWQECYRELLDLTRGHNGYTVVCRADRLPPGQPPGPTGAAVTAADVTGRNSPALS
jgi:hypothetical protein